MASPDKLAHVVLRTGGLPAMTDWYVRVLEGRVTFANEALAFLTYDDEHHRVALVATGATERPTDAHTGLHHVAFTYATIEDLLGTYRRLKGDGIHPFWCVNHGPTTSMYFEDPDGNHVELQIDNFATAEDLDEWFRSGAFEANPIGVDFDPDGLVRRFESGEALADLVRRA
ncbi:VOC family protein [Streptomyces sp. CBMA156]|uniref:VOC family protein n=1 Tax=Streptomyces sp. CBMA156 TaxID=1930280 RepID=UPI0016620A8B|nr:VOC family protein [Streptomyces sp. CBMA156]MBD0673714.1 biphenyl 2,3-dioxygenase [Streptomyces sp. CBMA156]